MNNFEPLTAILIIISTIIFMWLYIWPKFKKDTEVEIKGWKDIFKKILPSLIAKYFNLRFFVAIFIIIIGGLGIVADSQPSGSLFNAIFVGVLLFVCFFGLNKLIKLENPEAGAGQQILLWGIYGIIIFTIAHNALDKVIADEIYFIGITCGVPALTILWLISFWPNLQNIFAIPIGGVLLCSIFVLRGYVNTGYLPFANEASWIGYYPVIILAFATFILSAVFYKQKKWDERLSKKIISLISVVIISLMTPLILLMMMGKISPDKISRIAEYNRTVNFSKKAYSSALRKEGFVDYTIRESEKLLERFNRGDPSVTTEDIKDVTSNRLLAAKNYKKIAEQIRKNAPQEYSIEDLVFSEAISLYRECKNKINLFILRLQL